MERLLCIVSAMNTGGAETFLMKMYRCLDRDRYQMDFCVNSDENYYEEEIKSLGGYIYKIPLKSKNPVASFNAIKNIVREKDYSRVIRVNEHSLSTIDLIAARLGGAKVLAMRSSNAGTEGALNRVLHMMFRFLTDIVPNVRIAPSKLAADYTFGKKSVEKKNVLILKNGLDIDSFSFSNDIRKRYREELGLANKFVVGHIGRFNHQKNHNLLIDIFNEIQKQKSNSILLLIGSGELEEVIRKKIVKMDLLDKCIFLGTRNDVDKLLNVMDVFVFPSFYEGMPNTIIEAQTNGLPCLISDSITEETKVTEIVQSLNLGESPVVWAEKAIALGNNNINRTEINITMKENGYMITDVVNIFIKNIWENTNK